MKLTYHDYFRPSNDVVFAVMFSKRELFKRLCSAVTREEVDIIGDPHSQATLREDDVLLNTIRFDTFAFAIGNKFFSMDIQRKYREARQNKRTVYYACRAISTQPVEKMEYEKLKPVNISFLLVEGKEEKPIKQVKLCDIDTHEVFDDLIELTLVYVPAVLRSRDKADDLYIFASFFMVSGREEADKFSDEFGDSELGRELISMYNSSVANVVDLQQIERQPYFSGRLTEAEIEEARQIAREEERIKNARQLLEAGASPELVVQGTGLDMNTVLSLQKRK